ARWRVPEASAPVLPEGRTAQQLQPAKVRETAPATTAPSSDTACSPTGSLRSPAVPETVRIPGMSHSPHGGSRGETRGSFLSKTAAKDAETYDAAQLTAPIPP